MLVPEIGGGGGGGESSPLLPSTNQTLQPNKALEEVENNGKAKPIELFAIKQEQMMTTQPPPLNNTRAGSAAGNGGENVGSGGSSPSTSSAIKDLEMASKEVVLQFKEEDTGAVDCDNINSGDGGVTNNGNGVGSSSSSSVVLPKPMEGIHGSGPTPFLKKTFEMVEDPETNPIVSWSATRDSFIVWDSHNFSEKLLPKYFKHKNFSSFIRQLNTYGFRKIDSDRWEFANKGFQGGKKHLLKNINRRSRFIKKQQSAMSSGNVGTLGLEAEVEYLKKDQNTLRVEILKLRGQQQHSQLEISAVEERICRAECKQQHMLSFFAKVAKDPKFVQRLIQKRKQQKELDGGENGKKRRLLETHATKNLPEAMDAGVQSVNFGNQLREQLPTIQSELSGILSENLNLNTSPMQKLHSVSVGDEIGSPIQDQEGNKICPDMSYVYREMSENLMGDGSTDENVADEDVALNDSKFYLELEDLIGKPQSLSEYMSGLVEQTGCIGFVP